MKISLLLGVLVVSGSAFSAESSLENWVKAQSVRSLQNVYQAISPSDGARGAVMASPSRRNPDYYAHWIRDASLVMREVWAYRTVNPQQTMNAMRDFALFSRRNQMTDNLSGPADGMGIGEPKFEIDGRAFTASWGRPQNDGPALRVLSLLGFAEELMNTGGQDFVTRVLYRLELPAHTVIKADLEYIAHHWMDPSYDLWEEVMGDHFYTRIAQWRALYEGAIFAKKMNDDAAAVFYHNESVRVLESLDKFWSAPKGYLLTTRNQVAGAGDKYSNLDIAIVLGVLHSGRRGAPFYVDDDRVIATVFELTKSFDYQYAVNRDRMNNEGRIMGPGIGRYPEDRYDGYRTDSKGNPWFLATHAMAEYLLRLRGELIARGSLVVTDLSRPFYEELLKTSFSTKKRLQAGDPNYEAALVALQERSDAFIRRAKFHTGVAGSQSEQFNRVNGVMQGANDLTWSYASFLSLRRIRDAFYE